MVNKQLSEFEKDQIVAYSDCELTLCDIAKKLNHHHSSVYVFLKNYIFVNHLLKAWTDIIRQ